MRQLADSLPQSIQNNSVKFQYAYVLYYFGSNSLKINANCKCKLDTRTVKIS